MAAVDVVHRITEDWLLNSLLVSPTKEKVLCFWFLLVKTNQIPNQSVGFSSNHQGAMVYIPYMQKHNHIVFKHIFLSLNHLLCMSTWWVLNCLNLNAFAGQYCPEVDIWPRLAFGRPRERSIDVLLFASFKSSQGQKWILLINGHEVLWKGFCSLTNVYVSFYVCFAV